MCGISRVLSTAEAGEGHLSGTAIAGGLERPTRDSSGAGDSSSSIWPCSKWGLPCDSRLRQPGALLPHPFTLACASEKAIGGLLSAALSVIGRSRRPGVTRHPALWSSDFPPSMSRGTRRRPSLRASSELLFYRDLGTRTTPHEVNQRVQETPRVISRSERDTTSWPSCRNRISPRSPR